MGGKGTAIALGAIAALGLLCMIFGWWGPIYQLALGISKLFLIGGLVALGLLAGIYALTKDLPNNLGGMVAVVLIAVAILVALFLAGPAILQVLQKIIW